MSHKFFEHLWSYVGGIFGFSIAWQNIHWGELLSKITVAAVFAFIGGAIGHAGKLSFIWFVQKIRLLKTKFKSRK